jgi:hypothetical protein
MINEEGRKADKCSKVIPDHGDSDKARRGE